MDSLASAAFGMEVNSFNEENSKFIQCAAALFKLSVVDTILLMLKIVVPGLSRLFETFNINIWKVTHPFLALKQTIIVFFRREKQSFSTISSLPQ